MVIKSGVNQGALVIQLSGELDDNHAGKIRAQIDGAIEGSPARAVVFDMSKISFMDSTGIGIILGRYKRLRGTGRTIYIMNPNLPCDKLFTLSGIYNVIQKIGSLNEVR